MGVEEVKRWGSEIIGVESCGVSALRVAQVLIRSPGPPHLVPPASPQTREGLVGRAVCRPRDVPPDPAAPNQSCSETHRSEMGICPRS